MKDQWNGATATKRCQKRQLRIQALLVSLKPHCDYAKIFNFSSQILSLADYRSAIGSEDQAKELQKNLEKALKKIAKGSLNRALPASELALEDGQ